ncbi:HAD family hydrolase [Amycolatopsis magusensis]|uniref:Phosphoglycolate phosphatase n=1 Tax=Amycolatopsis magusensis TaxID=882444 RepID=A0ABS4PHZ6_9PSEU|nr:HAD family hydrolase [Amycolatopsis magusensis]MBP2179043.1 phosphoglycolate phosphatase [Amycolatopsis magusensis]MDI5978076.1 HAD family hydrolase [Amycolatopsis magusensis]
MGITVGFDLDMTLIDPRPGMVAALDALAEESGLPLDGEHFAANLGPPLDAVLRGFEAPEERIPELVDRFREIYPELVVPSTVALPGAHAALDAVHRAGGRTVVVTGKFAPNAARHIKALGFEVDVLVGELWSTGKAAALTEHGAEVYVGDHLGDINGALAAGAVPVGVTTGPCSRAELLEAGAEVVFDSLAEFPAWLAGLSPRA